MAKHAKLPATPTCPYCQQAAELVGGAVIYPNRQDLHGKNFWRCQPCDAWVGCHLGDRNIPLGRLADRELRHAKKDAYLAFDRLWKGLMRKDGIGKRRARARGYAWLAKQLGMARQDTHIGRFDLAQCRRVVEVCEPQHAENRSAA